MVGGRDVAASAASGAIACCEGLRARTGCADGMAAAIDPGFTHVACWKGRGDLVYGDWFWAGFGEIVRRFGEEVNLKRMLGTVE